MSDVLSASYFRSNAEIINACFRLKYLTPSMRILDPTFGGGKWWGTDAFINMTTTAKNLKLVKHDLILDGVDFRNLPHKANSFDAVAFDPPYVSIGGRESSNIKEMYAAYGLLGAPTSPAKLQKLINAGLAEMVRVVRPAKLSEATERVSGGIILVKVQDYVSSGERWPGVSKTIARGKKLGLVFEDQFIHVKKSGGPQPKNRTRKMKNGDIVASEQQHARNNWSTLLVFRKVA